LSEIERYVPDNEELRKSGTEIVTHAQTSLHGNVPDCSAVVLLLIDVINDFDFPNSGPLFRQARALGDRIAKLKSRCRLKGIPAVYVNDNRGKWRSDFSAVLAHCLKEDAPGRAMVERRIPDPQDYIVIKPKHSAFHATPLDTILTYLGPGCLFILLIPFVLLFDGIVSCARSYKKEESLDLFTGLVGSSYQWKAGECRNLSWTTPLFITYLTGVPTNTARVTTEG
jgi:hypothetical protein